MERDTDFAEALPWCVLVCHIVDKIILFRIGLFTWDGLFLWKILLFISGISS